jgi:hypothetical protein
MNQIYHSFANEIQTYEGKTNDLLKNVRNTSISYLGC